MLTDPDSPSAHMSEALSFPIGRFTRQPTYTPDERQAFIDRLAAQPAALAAALAALTPEQVERPYRPGGWTVRQVVHHVADSHMNMFIRVKLALSAAEPTINPYDQDAWVQHGDVATVAPSVSIALLAALHERMVALLRTLSADQFARVLLHPETGRQTIEQVVALYAWHGDHHIAHVRGAREE
jgi:uncharacterized damage-inducible protein DinB